MREIKKPEFQGIEGAWIDPEFFPDDLRRELLLHLAGSTLDEGQKSVLITFACEMAQSVFDGALPPTKQVLDELAAVESNARRLLASLNVLSPQAVEAVQIISSALPHGGYRDMPIPGHVRHGVGMCQSLLGLTWDWVAALEQISAKAASQRPMDRQTKPEQERARGYVSLLATRVHEQTGAWPPKSRNGWFSSFAAAIGIFLEYEIGPRIVASGIDQAAPMAR
jgi:hypothetical protein